MILFSRLAATAAIALGVAIFTCTPAAAMGGGGGGGTPSGGPNGGSWPTVSAKPQEYKDAVKLIKKDQCADAIPLLQQAADKAPKDPDVYNYLGYCQRKLGKYQDSFDNYRKALELDPNHKGAREYVGELFLDLNQLEDAQAQLEQLEKLCPKGCAERATLAQAIEDYKAKHAPPAPASPAPPSPPAGGQ